MGLFTASRIDFDVEGERRGGGVLFGGEKSCWEKIGVFEISCSRGAGATDLQPRRSLSKVSSTSTCSDAWLWGS